MKMLAFFFLPNSPKDGDPSKKPLDIVVTVQVEGTGGRSCSLCSQELPRASGPAASWKAASLAKANMFGAGNKDTGLLPGPLSA